MPTFFHRELVGNETVNDRTAPNIIPLFLEWLGLARVVLPCASQLVKLVRNVYTDAPQGRDVQRRPNSWSATPGRQRSAGRRGLAWLGVAQRGSTAAQHGAVVRRARGDMATSKRRLHGSTAE